MVKIEKGKKAPSEIKVGKDTYVGLTRPTSKKDEAEIDVKFARKCGTKAILRAFDLVGKRGLKRVWIVYGIIKK